MARKNGTRYNDKDELTFMRALFSALVVDLAALVDENKNGNREIMIVRTKGIRITEGEYVVVSVKADLKTRTTIPYLDIIECDYNELESNIKELMMAVAGTSRNMIVRVVNESENDDTSFRNELRVGYNSISERSIDSVFEDIDAMSDALTILGQIIKNAKSDLDEALELLDEESKENFRSSREIIELENTTIKKKGRAFTFKSGIILDVFGYDEDNDSYEELTATVDYKIKREVKNDSLY